MDFDPQMKKRMRKMLILVGILFGLIFVYKGIMSLMFKYYILANGKHVVNVSAMEAKYETWQSQISATGSLRAIRGVNVTTELAGMVQTIYFTPGSSVEQSTLLVQLNASSDLALLHSLEANAELAKVTYLRDKAQYAVRAVSKQTLDADAANLKSLRAQVAQQAATVAKKTIRAPFAGRLGISAINPGQYLNPGDTIVMLQTIDPIYVDFFIPQQALAKIKVGQLVTVTTDTFPGKKFEGKITTINPAVDTSTRNVGVEATISNPQAELTPGMFASVLVDTAQPQRYLTLPQTAISFNPYGELVYIIKETGQDKKGPILTVSQAFVITGETRGDQIAILKGLNEGEQVVTSGQLKLKNGSRVAINNSVVPPNNPSPSAPDEH
jgi:membrane fusion protein (multidrug efflux system)